VGSSPAPSQETSASAITEFNGPMRPRGNKALIKGREAMEDVRNAGTAKEDTDLTPKPPQRTGREAQAQASSERSQFEIFESDVFKASSKTATLGDRKHGEDLNT